MKQAFLFVVIVLAGAKANGQFDSSLLKQIKALDTMQVLRADTVAVPEDAFTQKIRTLRKEKKGLTAEYVMQVMIGEAKKKMGNDSAASKYLQEMANGHMATLFDNCLVNLYRRTFTEQEIDQLILFYRTSAGQKLNGENVLLMVRAVKDAEQLIKLMQQKNGHH